MIINYLLLTWFKYTVLQIEIQTFFCPPAKWLKWRLSCFEFPCYNYCLESEDFLVPCVLEFLINVNKGFYNFKNVFEFAYEFTSWYFLGMKPFLQTFTILWIQFFEIRKIFYITIWIHKRPSEIIGSLVVTVIVEMC